MSRLTVAEKEHWKSRIENRINKSIEALQAMDVTLMPSIRSKASIEAHRSLGTDKLHAKIEAISLQREALRVEQEQLEATMFRQALGPNSVNQPTYSNRHEFNEMHRRAQLRTEEDLLRKTSIGKEIMKLREEKDALLDTVWLATSSSQIRDLWSRVSHVLGDDATALQKRILTESSDTD